MANLDYKSIMASDIYYLIKDLGFPIAMCLYFMFINNSTIKENTKVIRELKTIVQIMNGKLKIELK